MHPTADMSDEDPIQIDLMYPWLARPVGDAKAAIAKSDFRFVVVARDAKWIPGYERQRLAAKSVQTKRIRHPSGPATTSAQFSFELRAKIYATRYNRTLFDYVKRVRHRRRPVR